MSFNMGFEDVFAVEGGGTNITREDAGQLTVLLSRGQLLLVLQLKMVDHLPPLLKHHLFVAKIARESHGCLHYQVIKAIYGTSFNNFWHYNFLLLKYRLLRLIILFDK